MKTGKKKAKYKFLIIKGKSIPLHENYAVFFSDITYILVELKNLFLSQTKNDYKSSENLDVFTFEVTFSYIIQFIQYKVLVDKNLMNTKIEYDRIKKKVNEQENISNILYGLDMMSCFMAKKMYYPYHKEQQEIVRKTIAYFILKNKLSLSPFSHIFHLINKYNFSIINNDILGSIYENFLKKISDTKNAGQYFTASPIVNYMLEEIGYTSSSIRNKNLEDISIIDPSCGSGVFLCAASQEIINVNDNNQHSLDIKIEKAIINNIHGIDKYSFPIYLAEMSLIMKVFPIMSNKVYNNPLKRKFNLYLTEDSIAEYINDKNIFKSNNHDLKKINIIDEVPFSVGLLNTKKRYDYVIGNPPYISYNQCSKDDLVFFKMLKNKNVKLNNVYGWNLHSIPYHIKKYSPKPNLYGFFIALGITLLKKEGKLCYIIPKTLLTSGSLNVIRYELSKRTTILKLITFSNNVFINRGQKLNDKVLTSSMIILCKNSKPNYNHKVDILVYNGKSQYSNDVFLDINKKEKKYVKKIPQTYLLKHCQNWNFIQHNKKMMKLYDKYNDNSQSMSAYYNHKQSQMQFGSAFWFDNGYIIDEKKMLEHSESVNDYFLPKKRRNRHYFEVLGYWKNERNEGDQYYIKLSQANQKYNFLDSKFKVIWSYTNPKKMYFSNGERIIWARNKFYGIGSSNFNECLYLFSLLNSRLTFTIVNLLLKNENEKDILLSNTFVKDFIRLPLVDTERKKKIKQKIIIKAGKMLELERDRDVDDDLLKNMKRSIDELVFKLYNLEENLEGYFMEN